MRVSLRSSFLLLAAILVPGGVTAQRPAPRPPTAVGEIVGRLVGPDGQPVAGGSIAVRRGTEAAFVGGALPRPDGSFVVDGLLPGTYTVRIRALGFAPLLKPDVVIAPASPRVDLGTLTLSRVAAQLSGQTVTAEREDVALAPDRNSYSTKNMTTASGGTAIDVLRNVPSVEVDASNNVSLRSNGNVVVQINGRTSPLKGEQLGTFLAQLPASAVKTVEVATNPSAKNDPEGTAGIINIVLDQEAEIGLSGGFTAGTGTTGQMNLSGNVGQQRGKLTAFLSASLYRDRRTTSGTSSRTNIGIPVPAFVESTSDGRNAPRYGSMNLRSEYRFSDRDALSFDGSYWGGRFAGGSAASYTNLDASGDVIGLFGLFNDRVSRNASRDFTAAFRRTGGPQATTFSSELSYSSNDNTNDAMLWGTLQQADPSTGPSTTQREHDYTTSHFPSWNWQTDYAHPFGAATKLETGFKGTQRNTASDFTAAYWDSTSGTYVPAPARDNRYDYREQIGAGYAVLSQRVGKAQLQGGLRLETAVTRLALPGVDQSYDTRYGSAFPSAIASWNFTEMRQAKVSYSRRVSRPWPGQLSPIEYRENARYVYRGNPDLRPEYTDALELGLQEARGWGSVQLTPYLRRTNNAVRSIQMVDTAGVTVRTFANVARATTVGSDLNVNFHAGALTLFTGGSAYRYSSDASNLAGNLSAKAIVWNARANATWKFTPLADMQLFGNYRAPYATEGGRQGASVFMMMAARYKVWGDQGNIALRVADPFNLTRFEYNSTSPQAVEYTVQRFQQRALFITVTRNFGQQLKLRPKQSEPDVQGTPGPGGPG